MAQVTFPTPALGASKKLPDGEEVELVRREIEAEGKKRGLVCRAVACRCMEGGGNKKGLRTCPTIKLLGKLDGRTGSETKDECLIRNKNENRGQK